MERTEVIVAVMVLLFGAYLLGFLTHWAVTRLTRVSDAELNQLDRMAEDLHRAEESRDAVQREIGELRGDLVAMRDALLAERAEADELRRYIEAQSNRGL